MISTTDGKGGAPNVGDAAAQQRQRPPESCMLKSRIHKYHGLATPKALKTAPISEFKTIF